MRLPCAKCGALPGMVSGSHGYTVGVPNESGTCCSAGPYPSGREAMMAWDEMQRATPVAPLISLPIEEACARKHADGVREHRDSEADGFAGDPIEEAFAEAVDGINYCREAERQGKKTNGALRLFYAAAIGLQDAAKGDYFSGMAPGSAEPACARKAEAE